MVEWLNETDAWEVIILSLAKDSPREAILMREACTYMQIANAWANNRRTTEGVGYRIEYGK